MTATITYTDGLTLPTGTVRNDRGVIDRLVVELTCPILDRVVGDRTVARYGRGGAHAWVSPSFTYPHAWTVSIPRGNDSYRTIWVSGLEEALGVAADHGVELDVDDWTYGVMLAEGAAPAIRPERALQPEGEYPGRGLGDEDVRPMSLAVLQHAPAFIGLNAAEAQMLAKQRGIEVRIRRDGELVTLDYCPTRLNLRLVKDRIESASIG